MPEFSRTPEGLAAYHNFVSSPLIWVEGGDDITFYENALGIDGALIQRVGGRLECERIAKDTIQRDLPQVVVMDGDYGILERGRNPHRRVIYLTRYSIENYLLEKEALNRLACEVANELPRHVDLVPELDSILAGLERCLGSLIETDIGHQRFGTGQKVMPPSGGLFKQSKRTLVIIREDQVQSRIKRYRNQVPHTIVASVRRQIDAHLAKSRFADLVPGHHVFHLLRTILCSAVRRRGKKFHCDNGILLALLCKYIWAKPPTKAHSSLRRKLREAYREAKKLKVT